MKFPLFTASFNDSAKAIALLGLFGSASIQSQVVKDAGLWTTASLEIGVNSRVTFLLTEEMRLKENLSQLNLLFTDVGFQYKVSKNVRTSLTYRAIQRYRLEGYFSNTHRLQWDIVLKKKLQKVEFSYRHRLQSAMRDIYSSETGTIPAWNSRHKLQMKLDTDKAYAPYVSTELRYQIADPRGRQTDNLLNRIRYQFGFDYKLNSRNVFGLYYLIQNELNVEDPTNLYVIGLEYTYKL